MSHHGFVMLGRQGEEMWPGIGSSWTRSTHRHLPGGLGLPPHSSQHSPGGGRTLSTLRLVDGAVQHNLS